MKNFRLVAFVALNITSLVSPLARAQEFCDRQAEATAIPPHAVTAVGDVVAQLPGETYDSLNPIYVEVCAASEIQRAHAGHGGQGGHYVAYLKGVCPDTSAEFPQVKMCDEGSIDLSNPESGTGVSLDGSYKNVKWTAIQGKTVFLKGITPDFSKARTDDEKKALQAEALRLTEAEAIRQQVFKGVEVKDEKLAPKPGQTVEQAKAEKFLGTDFGVGLARNLRCERMPINKAMMADVVKGLNQINQDVHSGKVKYNWSGLGDNCTHLVHNALAAAGIWPAKPTVDTVNPLASKNPIKIVKTAVNDLRQIRHLAVPTNEYIDSVQYSNDRDLNDPFKLYEDKESRKMIEKYHWVGVQGGAVTERIDANPEMWDAFTPINEMFTVDAGVVGDFVVDKVSKGKVKSSHLPHPRDKALAKIESSTRYSDLTEQLNHMKNKYEEALKSLDKSHSLKRYKLAGVTYQNRGFTEFFGEYRKTLEAGLAEINRQLSKLPAASPVAPATVPAASAPVDYPVVAPEAERG